MPENGKVESNGVVSVSAENVQEAMRRLTVEDGEDGVSSAAAAQYPDRPGEPNCIYYLRTGLCGYGTNCRFNHPPYSPMQQVGQYTAELPERPEQPDCQYFLKTGTCRFGATCKYNHPRDKLEAGQVPLNILGLPMRQEEKPCPYYMRNATCKFGVACKFHHPPPVSVPGSTAYGSTSSSSGVAYAGGLPAWSVPRAPYLPGARMQAPHAYMPLVFSPPQGIMHAQQGWNTYTGMMSQVLGSNPYNPTKQGEEGSGAQAPLLSTPVPHFPERPDQPECQYYMKTGSCKFGQTCKYHHPKEKIALSAPVALGPHGLPLRPGQAMCIFYITYGICKFGSTCKFDHPLPGFYNYGVGLNVPTLTMPQAPYPYQKNSIPSSSSETSPSKSSRVLDRNGKPETVSPEHQSVDVKESEGDQQASPSPLEPLSRDQSD